MLFAGFLGLVPFATLGLAALAPLYTPEQVDSIIADKYVIKLKNDSSFLTVARSGRNDRLNKAFEKADHIYDGVFKGFAAKLDAVTLKLFREHPDVEYVERDALISIAGYVTQANAPWNLARISHRSLGFTTYVYDDSAGLGTCVYILDTGIAATHPQFGGRAIQGANFAGGSATDGNGHGTAVAGVIGSIIYGVAKKTTIIGVKVVGDNGSGAISNIIAGFNYVSQDSATRNCPKGVIINISLGGGYSAALNNAAAASVRSGKLVAAAAGSGGTNLANFSPASEPLVCTVGATTASDSVSTSSNYGPGLDVWAPGQNIITTWLNGGTQTLSGTSLAAPHVAGLGAYLAALEGVNPGALCARIQQLATPNILTGVPAGTNNLLIFNGNPTG